MDNYFFIYFISSPINQVLSSVEAFDFEKNEWIDLPSLEQPRFLASMSVLQGKRTDSPHHLSLSPH